MEKFGQPKFEKTEKAEKNEYPYQEIIDTPEFQEWFKGSFVEDDNGNPLIVYHSTNRKEWEGQEFKNNDDDDSLWCSFGIYFSSDRESTRKFYSDSYVDQVERYERLLADKGASGDERKQIYRDQQEYLAKNEAAVKTFNCFLSIKNPLILNDQRELQELGFKGENRKSLAKKYDGIIVKNDLQFGPQYIAFDPKQIWMLPSDIELHRNNTPESEKELEEMVDCDDYEKYKRSI